jgi:hypothetical protein
MSTPKRFLQTDTLGLTLGRLHERLLADGYDVTASQVKYAIERYHIAPAGRVGILRVWSEDSVPLVKSALARISSSRSSL